MNSELERLLDEAKKRPPMTAKEINEQRCSWVRGELMLEHPEMTWEEANQRVRETEKRIYGISPE